MKISGQAILLLLRQAAHIEALYEDNQRKAAQVAELERALATTENCWREERNLRASLECKLAA